MIKETAFIIGNQKIKVKLQLDHNRIFIYAPYHKGLIEEIKNSFSGAKWHGFDDPPKKVWSIDTSLRNSFVIKFLEGVNTYQRYEKELLSFPQGFNGREYYKHQIEQIQHYITRRYSIGAAEMGTGKSLAAISATEYLIKESTTPQGEAWYVGPNSGVIAFSRELIKWKSELQFKLFTYEQIVKLLANWTPGLKAPQFLIFDESSKLKTPTSQRSQSARYLANCVLREWKEDGFVICLSGTPSPKSPLDWWNQCETVCPGYLREGNINSFRKRLALVENEESITGGMYPKLITWWDDENKCAKCGQYQDHMNHDQKIAFLENVDTYHPFEKSVNEIAKLYRRLKGLVIVQFKKDCLDLPEIQYRVIECEPSVEVIRSANLIKKTASRAIQALTLLRELSDGFIYKDESSISQAFDNYDDEGDVKDISKLKGVLTFDCPKDQIFKDLLDEYEEVGRFVVWGGFTATLDKLVNIAIGEGWAVLRVDGRGYKGFNADFSDAPVDDLLDAMEGEHPRKRAMENKYPKVCVVGQPQAGGMALTFTASPVALFYSNTFNGEGRFQAEARIHRISMDLNRGATVIDLIHLETDKKVLDNLKNKKRLQDMTMGEL